MGEEIKDICLSSTQILTSRHCEPQTEEWESIILFQIHTRQIYTCNLRKAFQEVSIKQHLVYENTVVQLMYFFGAGLVYRSLGPSCLDFPREKKQ